MKRIFVLKSSVNCIYVITCRRFDRHQNKKVVSAESLHSFINKNKILAKFPNFGIILRIFLTNQSVTIDNIYFSAIFAMVIFDCILYKKITNITCMFECSGIKHVYGQRTR